MAPDAAPSTLPSRRQWLRRGFGMAIGTGLLEALNRLVFRIRGAPRSRMLADCPKPYVRSCMVPHDRGLTNALGYWEREYVREPGSRTVVVVGASATLLPRDPEGARNDFPYLADLILDPRADPTALAERCDPRALPERLRVGGGPPIRLYNFSVNGWSLHEIAAMVENELAALAPDVLVVSEPTNTVTERSYRNPQGLERYVSWLPGYELLTFVGVVPSGMLRALELRRTPLDRREYTGERAPDEEFEAERRLLEAILGAAERAGALLVLGNHPDALRPPPPGGTEIGHAIAERFVVLGDRPWASYWRLKRGFTHMTAGFVRDAAAHGRRVALVDWEQKLDGYAFFDDMHTYADETGALRLILGRPPATFAVDASGCLTRDGLRLRRIAGHGSNPLTGRSYVPDRVETEAGDLVASIEFEDVETGLPLLASERNGTKQRLFHDPYHPNETGALILAILTAQALRDLEAHGKIPG